MANVDIVELQVPDHIPSELVVDFDFYADPRFKLGTHEALVQLSKEAPPIFFTPRNGGHWVVIGFEEMNDVLANTELFSSAKTMLPLSADPSAVGSRFVPLQLDPPEHAPSRRAMTRALPPNKMRGLEGAVRAMAQEYVESVAEKGGCEFVAAIAEPLPSRIALRALGLPESRLAEFRAWEHDFVSSEDHNVKLSALQLMWDAILEVTKERRAMPLDDMISHLIEVQLEPGRTLTDDEIKEIAVLIFIGGLDTTTNTLSHTWRYLAEDQGLQSRLRADSSMIKPAVEELLRRNGTGISGRVIAKDDVFRGIQFKTGDGVLMLFPATNMDARKWESPLTCDIDQGIPSHLTFGGGIHNCFGAPLARMEFRVLIEEFFARIPQFSLDPERPPVFSDQQGHNLVIESLHLRW